MVLNGIIIFEGVDGSGKTTLKEEIMRRTNRFVCVDRFIGSQIVYDKLFGRGDVREAVLLSFEREIARHVPVLLVYVKCSETELLLRLKDRKNKDPADYSYEKVSSLYRDYLDKSSFNVVVLDTTRLTPDECVDKILNTMEELQ